MTVEDRSGRLQRLTRRLRPGSTDVIAADHVGFLDGDSLWISIGQGLAPGDELALRDTSTGELLRLAGTRVEGGALQSCVDLSVHAARIAESEGTELVVLRDGEAHPVQTVGLPPDERPFMIPPCRDGRFAFRARSADVFTVTAIRAEPAVEVLAARLGEEAIEITTSAPADTAVTAWLVTRKGASSEVPVARTEDGWTVEITDRLVPAVVGEAAQLWVEYAGERRPVRRRYRDLRAPGSAVTLPSISGEGPTGDTVISAEFRSDGQLVVRRRPAARG